MNKLQWNFNLNSDIFFQENALESVVCEMAAILSRPQCVKKLRWGQRIRQSGSKCANWHGIKDGWWWCHLRELRSFWNKNNLLTHFRPETPASDISHRYTIRGAVSFQFAHFLVMIERIYILCLIIIIKSEVWTITHCLGLGHETMVCAVCLFVFVCTSITET